MKKYIALSLITTAHIFSAATTTNNENNLVRHIQQILNAHDGDISLNYEEVKKKVAIQVKQLIATQTDFQLQNALESLSQKRRDERTNLIMGFINFTLLARRAKSEKKKAQSSFSGFKDVSYHVSQRPKYIKEHSNYDAELARALALSMQDLNLQQEQEEDEELLQALALSMEEQPSLTLVEDAAPQVASSSNGFVDSRQQ